MFSNIANGCARGLALTLVLMLGACSTLQDFAGIPRAGHQKDGTYIPTEEDQSLACRQIRERIDALSRQIKYLPQQAAFEQQSQPSTVGSALGRMFGQPGAGLQSTKDFQK